MQPNIEAIMGKVLELVPGSRSATVWIERPLQAGIQLEAEVAAGKDNREFVIVENDEEFMAFVQSYKSKSPWNRMTIHLRKKGDVVIETSFDKDLEDDALEKTK